MASPPSHISTFPATPSVSQLHASHVKKIKRDFAALKDLDGLARLLTYCRYAPRFETAQELTASLYGDENEKDPNLKPVRKKLLTYYGLIAPQKGRELYESFTIPKASGGQRKILAPKVGLKRIQQAINLALNVVFIPHFAAHGFVPGRSIVTNAEKHVGKPHVLNLDLKDFFPSVQFRRVKTVLGLAPFNLKDEREELGFLIANLCCYKGVLPQGAPTSPTLSNVVCQRLDRKLHRLARQHEASYTRYADDLTFSRYDGVFDAAFEQAVAEVVEDERFLINPKKVRQQHRSIRQEVTGLTVNEKVNVSRPYLRNTRTMLHKWDQGGLVAATEAFYENYRGPEPRPQFLASLLGRIHFIGMVRGKEDATYVHMLQKYWRLWEREGKPSPADTNRIDLEALITAWESKDADAAFQLLNEEQRNTLSQTSRPLQLAQLIWREMSQQKGYEDEESGKPEGNPSLLARFHKLVAPWAGQLMELIEGEDAIRVSESSEEELNPEPVTMEDNQTGKEESNPKGLKYASPRDAAYFLEEAFSQSTYLKYLTHDNTHGYTYTELIEGAKKEYWELTKRYPQVDKKLRGIVWGFAFETDQSKNWTAGDRARRQIKVGWSKPSVKAWCNDRTDWLSPDENPTFDGFVSKFKTSIEVRGEDLREILDSSFMATRCQDSRIELIFHQNFQDITFYTHVEKLRLALRAIFTASIKHNKAKKLLCHAYFSVENAEERILQIYEPFKTVRRVEKYAHSHEFTRKGELRDAKKNLNGLCEWGIETRFIDGPFYLPILGKNPNQEKRQVPDHDIRGFCHVLTFYIKVDEEDIII